MNEQEDRVGWMSISSQQQPNWAAAATACTDDTMNADIELIVQCFNTTRLPVVTLWEQQVYVAQDETIAAAISRLHHAGVLLLAGFSDECDLL